MDMGEAVKAAEAMKPEKYCEESPALGNNWKARVNQWGTHQNCTGTRLYKNLRDENKAKVASGEKTNPCFVAKATIPHKTWNLGLCSPDRFPVQAHHLIPKNHLPKHDVCVWLAAGYTEDGVYQLAEDNDYDTDDVENGYCLPYASPMAEWRAAKNLPATAVDAEKQLVAFRVMDNTGRQLHQGSHTSTPYEEPVAANEANEEDEIHKEHIPYLLAVNDLLNVVYAGALGHVQSCEDCKKNGLKNLAPLKPIAEHMHEVSKIIYSLVKANTIHVSKYAYLYHKK